MQTLLETIKSNKWAHALVIIFTLLGSCALVGILGYLLSVLSLPVSTIIWTVVLIFCLRGIVTKFEKLGVNRLLGTTFAYIIMVLFLVLVFFLMFSPVFGINEQFANLISSIPTYVDQIEHWYDGFSEKYSNLFDNETVKSMISSASSSLSNWASDLASGAASGVMGVGTAAANTLYAIGFALVIAFWILMELPAMGREVMRLVPGKRRSEVEFLHITFTRILGGYIKGTLLQCLIIGVACGILFAVIRIPNAPALGVITGVLNIIPIVGPWLGGVVAAITAVFISPLTALIALLGTIVIQQFVYTFVSPKIMQNSVSIHPVMTLIAMIFGSAIGGAMSGLVGSLVGMLFSIPAVAVMKSLFIYYYERSTDRQIVSPDGFLFKGEPSQGTVDPIYDATGGDTCSLDKGTEECLVENSDKAEKSGKANKVEKSGKANKVEKSDEASKIEESGKVDKIEESDKVGKADKDGNSKKEAE